MEGLAHLHSVYSYDGKLTLEELKEECKKRDLQFLLMTEHAEDFDSKKMEALVAHCSFLSDEDFFIVPGLEFVVDVEHDVHLLAFGLSAMPPDNAFESIAAAVNQSGGFTVLAHPRRNNYYLPAEVKGNIDGVEVWNAAYDSRYLPNDKSYRLLGRLRADNAKKLAFAGLDLHDLTGFRNVTISLADKCESREELLQSLKQGSYRIQSPYVSLRPEWSPCQLTLRLLATARAFLNGADRIKWNWTRVKGSARKGAHKASDHASS